MCISTLLDLYQHLKAALICSCLLTGSLDDQKLCRCKTVLQTQSPKPSSSQLEPHSYATQLKTIIHKLQSPTTCKQKQCTIHIHSGLSSCPYVLVRHDGAGKSLQPPYDRPFKVLQRFSKHFTLDIAGQKIIISLDRLKPAYMDISQDTVSDSLP